MKKRSITYLVRKTVRFSQAEIERLTVLLGKASECQNLSELVREMLFKRTLRIDVRDESRDQLRTELGMIRTEMNRIGVNINQITHFFHMQASPAERDYFVRELLPHLKLMEKQLQDLGAKIEKVGSV